VSMKIRIIAELSLTHIEPVQLSFIVGHWAHGLRVHPSLADPRDSKKVFSRSVLFPSPFGERVGATALASDKHDLPKREEMVAVSILLLAKRRFLCGTWLSVSR
jgi:hypothetical protein